MRTNRDIKVALMGNPNTGKTSLFNALTGLNQRVGNYPGITVEKKEGVCKLSQLNRAVIYDLPGTYSLNANSQDETIAIDFLLNKNNANFPDVVLVVADVENLKHNLLLFTQIKDLNIPTILVVNMSDRMKKRGISVDVEEIEKRLKTKVVLVSNRSGDGIEKLKELIIDYKGLNTEGLLDLKKIDSSFFSYLKETYPEENPYKLWIVISQNAQQVSQMRKVEIGGEYVKNASEIKKMQQRETIGRYILINNALKDTYKREFAEATTRNLDKFFIHPVGGYIIFALILIVMFQMIYYVSQYPMQWIENTFNWFGATAQAYLPQGPFTQLLLDGVLAGITGIVVFVPQIMILFLFISILEESGYMSRVVFLMDKIMRPFGLSGKSIIPLVSSAACAVPAVMGTRNIEDWKQRLITIMVTPFITCSARLPVYLIMIELVIPQGEIFIFGYKGLALFFMYFLGVFMAVFSAWILKKAIKQDKSVKNYFIVEMPSYKSPLLRNVVTTVFEKTKTFVFEAGRIILAISVVIWFLHSHGIGESYTSAETKAQEVALSKGLNQREKENYLQAYKIENSLLGNLGKAIEPVFRPLGYDWKMSIGILCSFVAREVFVSTLTTIYSLGPDIADDENGQKTIIEKMRQEKRADGTPVFSFATAVSVLLFYAFAMQCLSTMAVVRKETNGWKWPLIQWSAMTSMAYLLAFLAYNILK